MGVVTLVLAFSLACEADGLLLVKLSVVVATPLNTYVEKILFEFLDDVILLLFCSHA